MVMMRVAGSSNDLHASDAGYHNDCLNRFVSQRNSPGESIGTHDEEQEEMLKSTEMPANRTKICTMFCMCRGGDGCSNKIESFQGHKKVVLELNLIPLNLL